jgi:hypothetical protein
VRRPPNSRETQDKPEICDKVLVSNFTLLCLQPSSPVLFDVKCLLFLCLPMVSPCITPLFQVPRPSPSVVSTSRSTAPLAPTQLGLFHLCLQFYRYPLHAHSIPGVQHSQPNLLLRPCILASSAFVHLGFINLTSLFVHSKLPSLLCLLIFLSPHLQSSPLLSSIVTLLSQFLITSIFLVSSCLSAPRCSAPRRSSFSAPSDVYFRFRLRLRLLLLSFLSLLLLLLSGIMDLGFTCRCHRLAGARP